MKTVFWYNVDDFSVEEIKVLRKIPLTHRDEISDSIVNNGMVDIFDFVTYVKEYNLMSQYFKGLTRDLKTALLIDYKYNHTTSEGWDKFNKVFNSKKTAKEKKMWLELTFDVFEPQYILHHFYRHYLPEKTTQEIDKIYEKYDRVPSTMFNCVYRKYVNHEWQNEKLWFA